LRIPGEEKDRYYCAYCGFPCKLDEAELGNYGANGWNTTTGYTIADDGISTASNFISNGAFTSNTTGWTGLYCTLASAASGQSGNCLRITRTSEDEQYAYQALSGLSIGFMYRVMVYVKSGTSGNEDYALRIYSNDRTVLIREVTGTSSSSWVLASPLYWRATQTNNVIALVKDSNTAGTMFFDTVTVYGYEFMALEDGQGCPLCHSKNWKK